MGPATLALLPSVLGAPAPVPGQPSGLTVELGAGVAACGPSCDHEAGVGLEARLGWRFASILEAGGGAIVAVGEELNLTFGFAELRVFPLRARPFAFFLGAAPAFGGGVTSDLPIRVEWSGFALVGRLGAEVELSEETSLGLWAGRLFGFGESDCALPPYYGYGPGCTSALRSAPELWLLMAAIDFGA